MVYKPRSLIHENESLFEIRLGGTHDGCIFWDVAKKRLYYELLSKYHSTYNILFHSYCFLDRQVLLTGKMRSQEEFSKFFRLVHSLFFRVIRRETGMELRHTERFKSFPIASEKDLLKVMIRSDLQPCREGIVEDPGFYPFSSYRHFALGIEDPFLHPPDSYLRLGKDPKERQRKYQEKVRQVQKHGKYFSWLGKPKTFSPPFIAAVRGETEDKVIRRQARM